MAVGIRLNDSNRVPAFSEVFQDDRPGPDSSGICPEEVLDGPGAGSGEQSGISVNKVINQALAVGVLPALGDLPLPGTPQSDLSGSEALGGGVGVPEADRSRVSP